MELSLRSEVRTSPGPEGWTDGQTDTQTAVRVGCVNSREPAELKPPKQSGIVPVHNIRGLVTGQWDHSMAVLGPPPRGVQMMGSTTSPIRCVLSSRASLSCCDYVRVLAWSRFTLISVRDNILFTFRNTLFISLYLMDSSIRTQHGVKNCL